MIPQEQIKSFFDTVQAIRSEIAKEIIGQERVVEQLLTALIAGGNVLLEGVPGLGKTRLVRTLSSVFDLPFSRIQFTPDLMPADITGTNIIVKTEAGNEFRFRKGPLFASIVLADEINRATPKTQAALLEAMQEHSVTVGGETHALSEPYFVLATQNPMEQEGTYPLPEAQLDRFMLKILVDFPTLEELAEIVGLTTVPQTSHARCVADADTLMGLRAVAQEVPVAQAVRDFALRLVSGDASRTGAEPGGGAPLRAFRREPARGAGADRHLARPRADERALQCRLRGHRSRCARVPQASHRPEL